MEKREAMKLLKTAFLSVLVVTGCATKEKQMSDPLSDARDFWFRMLDSLNDAAFDPVSEEDLPSNVILHSSLWEGFVFRPAAGWSRAEPKARGSVHASQPDTLDLVRRDYAYAGVRSTVLESTQFIYLFFREIPEKYGRDSIRCAESLAALFLKSPQPLRFTSVTPKVFSTGTSVKPSEEESWYVERIDGRPLGDGVALLCFKACLPQGHKEILPRQWFDPEFRKRHSP
jgi:hypothetical protein